MTTEPLYAKKALQGIGEQQRHRSACTSIVWSVPLQNIYIFCNIQWSCKGTLDSNPRNSKSTDQPGQMCKVICAFTNCICLEPDEIFTRGNSNENKVWFLKSIISCGDYSHELSNLIFVGEIIVFLKFYLLIFIFSMHFMNCATYVACTAQHNIWRQL